ncbi:regulation of nuclear pre-mRNA domain-containing protein 2-like [Pollicipes pollicipes]|uniref:regulation of nuclear pre-mRNA domain-containing protein 2-like n=1 Tax=Pollicipes pollicipes TaxID=41117 RepID=UPI001884D33A|nr:regulation of nuclear pre-mRNA domain-containing protein 2-like [Pollicipes pollicipes]
MVMSAFSQLDLEKRLSQLKDTAESIQTLSAWCLKHKHQHRRIVNSWFKIIKRAKVQQRLPLFYLANDVIQYSKRKSLDFVPSFQTVLEGAMPLVRDEKLRPAITRILKIWDDRGIFPQEFIATLTNVVSNVSKADTKENAQILSDFRTSDLIKHVREVDETEKETDKRLKAINDGEFHVSDTAIEELRANVKSRSQSKLFVSELEEGIRAVERYVSALDREIQQRAELIEQLERSEIYYETQRNDAKVVAVAYKNFSKRVREMKKKVEEGLPDLPDVSPVPSPDINAPSPTNSDDGLQLPDDAGSSDKTDPRSEIERLLGSWTSGNTSNSPKSTGAPENGAPSGSSITVVTGVQQGGTVSARDTPLEDDHDYEDDYEAGPSGGQLSDFMRLIGQKLQPSVADSDHRLWDRSVDDFISQAEADEPSLSSWSSSVGSPEPEEGRSERHRSREHRKKRRRRDSAGHRHKKERHHSASRTGKAKKRRSSEREKERPRDKDREKGRSRDRDREREREKERSREEREKGRSRDHGRSRSRSRERDRSEGRRRSGGGGFDYSQVGAGAHKAGGSGATHRDRGSRRW